MLAHTRMGLPWVVLGAGVIISVLLASMVRSGQVSAARSGELLADAMELRGRVKELDREKAELQASNAEKDERTRELENRMNGSTSEQNPVMAELEAFTYSVSHDLRSPMGAILNYAAILAEDCGEALGEEGRDHLARISGSARTAVAMMDSLLAFSRIGRTELKITEVNVRNLVKEVFEELRQSRRRLSPEADLSMGELPSIRADPTLLRVLFTNLLSNALKFTHLVPSPAIEVGGYVQGEETTYYVKDNGIGFDMENASKIFGVFERLHNLEDYDGHGVGLALVERIARRHGGSARAEGALGKGATFFVVLPNEPVPT
jgi:light-regulated signal transduction histidine kinase (bacteriophytochrome)